MKRIWSNWTLSTLPVGMQNSTGILENWLLFKKVNLRLFNIWSQQSHTDILTQEKRKYLVIKNLYINVCRAFIHNCQSLETTWMSFNWWMHTLSMEHPYDDMLFSNMKEHTTPYMQQRIHYAKWKKPDQRGNVPRFHSIQYSQKCKTTKKKNNHWLPG